MSYITRTKDWDIKINKNYEPEVSIIVPTYNESKVIVKKIINLSNINYPSNKLEILIVDSASNDNTVEIAKDYIKNFDFPFKVKFLIEKERRGKAKALNYALEHAEYDIIATSDADSYWEPLALKMALSYLYDQTVGAVTGREKFLNKNQNILTLGEELYRQIYYKMRIGESKLHSTQIFQGELSIYKRSLFNKFNDEKGSDDCGTVVNIISKGYRTILSPESIFYDFAPTKLKDRFILKKRRALHVIHALLIAIKLKIKNLFPQPSRILYTNFFIHIINPFLIVPLFFFIMYFIYIKPILIALILLLLIKRFRTMFVAYFSSNLALIMAVISYMRGEELIKWEKIQGMR